jgi:acetate kinase
MTDAEPELNVLALNSGSSSPNFGLDCAGSSRIEMLLSGEAESIGDQRSKCHAEDSHGNALLAETTAFAPLHIPSAPSIIGLAQEHFPGLPRAACFDATFCAKMPAVALLHSVSAGILPALADR